ncbi:MAG: InlB B-repeat-containing protein, partial [Clostridia bacterium]|nr:InlB B-repeat-containing protein [Clostridia bacterium]
ANGGNGTMASQTFNAGAPSNLNANTFTREHYDFGGWATSANGAVEYADRASTTTILTDLTLYAVWTPKTYVITFDGNGGFDAQTGTISTTTRNLPYGQAFTMPSADVFSRIGHTFLGWSVVKSNTLPEYQANQTVAFNSSGDIFGRNTTLYAIWEANTYTITADPNGGVFSPTQGWILSNNNTVATKTVTYGQVVGQLPTVTKIGYIYDCYVTDDGWFDESQPYSIAGNITIRAAYNIATYYITISANGGSFSDSTIEKYISGTYQETINLQTYTPTRTDYKFGGWKILDANRNEITDGSGGSLNDANTIYTCGYKDVILEAQWEAQNVSYNIYWYVMNADGTYSTLPTYQITELGIVDSSSQVATIEQGARKKHNDKIILNGMTLDDLYTAQHISLDRCEVDGVTVSTTITYKKNMTVAFYYAREQLKLSVNIFKHLTNNTDVILTPSKGSFDNENTLTWCYDTNPITIEISTTNSDVDYTLMIGSDYMTNTITYTWTPTSGGGIGVDVYELFNVTAEVTTGLNIDSITYTGEAIQNFVLEITGKVEYGCQINIVGTLYEGYNFQGWYVNGELITTVLGDEYNGAMVCSSITEDIVIEGRATPKKTTVTFVPGSGASVDPTSKQVIYGETYGDLPIPTKEGYTFTGWAKSDGYTYISDYISFDGMGPPNPTDVLATLKPGNTYRITIGKAELDAGSATQFAIMAIET